MKLYERSLYIAWLVYLTLKYRKIGDINDTQDDTLTKIVERNNIQDGALEKIQEFLLHFQLNFDNLSKVNESEINLDETFNYESLNKETRAGEASPMISQRRKENINKKLLPSINHNFENSPFKKTKHRKAIHSYIEKASMNIKTDTEKRNLITTSSQSYPSRECLNEQCICDSRPNLSVNFDEGDMYNIKIQTFLEISILSGSEKLKDVNSPQYKAACWIFNDDAHQYHSMSSNQNKLSQMVNPEILLRDKMQRYILAVFFFETNPPQGWFDHYNFLSSLSVCKWNNKDNEDHNIMGVVCDENENVLSLSFVNNNLDGTICQELMGLKSLESLHLKYNPELRGKIPPSFGRLSYFSSLSLFGNSVEGTIPSTLFTKNMKSLDIGRNNLKGTIPPSIANSHDLIDICMDENNLSGSIPDAIYKLKNLEVLNLHGNRLSSSISPLIGNLRKLTKLFLDDNEFSNSIPGQLFELSNIDEVALNKNFLFGSIPKEFCTHSIVLADCRNDVFNPEVICTCCDFCEDESPRWNGNCPDASMKVMIDHDYDYSSYGLTWSMNDASTENMILYQGPYRYNKGKTIYEACVAHTECFSLNMLSPPEKNTNYTIHWNDELIYNGTFQVHGSNSTDYDYYDFYRNEDPDTLLTFQYDALNGEVIFKRTSSNEIIFYECNDMKDIISIKSNSQLMMYTEAIKISGSEKINDFTSPQSKALCWILKNENNNDDNVEEQSFSEEFTQRYVLTLMHIISKSGLFGDAEYPPETDECSWKGVVCENTSIKDTNWNAVSTISMSAEYNQIIGATIIEEFGSLKYLKVLKLNETKLHGTIPRSLSNLWSLVELDLSGNELTGVLPPTLFQQVSRLEHIDLSDNQLTQSIPHDIGSYTSLRTILLANNLFTGSMPLERFEQHCLEHFDVSNNKLSSLEFILLLNHTELKTLDISSNFFVGQIPQHTFTSLPKLQHFNISQNGFSGIIPPVFPEFSNITQLDIHSNQIRGSIPMDISKFSNVQHLNLQGNQLTGSIPNFNNLTQLRVLSLSHNNLKGNIPFELEKMPKMELLHLHMNKLSGNAPEFMNMRSYITDCGTPSNSLEPVKCDTCSICCNSDGLCHKHSANSMRSMVSATLFMISVVGVIIFCYMLKGYIISNKILKTFFSETVSSWNALSLIGEKSVYHFLILKNKAEWYIALFCLMFQIATLFLFVDAADKNNETSDKEYSIMCSSNSFDCEDSRSVNSYGYFVFGVILTVWLSTDIIRSVKLMLLSFEKKNIDYFFASGMMFAVTMLSFWSSIYYIHGIAIKNTDLIKDAVVLLFVIEIDERILEVVEAINPVWTSEIENNLNRSVYDGQDLVINSWVKKSAEKVDMVSTNFFKRSRPTQGISEENNEINVEQRASRV